MFKKVVIAWVVVGALVIGYPGFSGSAAQASHNCGSDSTVLAANPELAVACRYHGSVTGNETETPRVIEASAVRSIGLPSSTFFAANPELMVVSRYRALMEARADSTYLAANPELMVVRRYAALMALSGEGD